MKQKIGIFGATIKAQSGDQKAVVLVSVPDGVKTWGHVVVSTGVDCGDEVLFVHQVSSARMLDVKSKIIPAVFPNFRIMPREQDNIGKAEIVLDCKIDDALALSAQFDSAKLSDSDYSNSGSTLEAYIKKYFTVAQGVEDFSSSAKRKIIFPKAAINWDETWNSPFLTDEEKENMRHPLDLDIAMSNAGRDCRKIFEKIMTTSYYLKNYTLIGLHGNPSGGKTKMVLNDYCALNNIPVVAIPCDPMMSVTQILSQVGPVNKTPLMTVKELSPIINELKNQLSLLEQAPEGQRDDAKISTIIDTLDKVASISKECADLVKTPSILMKCLRHNLPLVVFLDEANVSTIQFQNSLAPIISDGIYKDGPEVGRNNGTIKWVLAWNPNTSNTKSFDGKFFDRISFIQVEDISPEQRIDYRTRKTLFGMYGNGTPDYSRVDEIIDHGSEDKCALSEEQLQHLKERVHTICASEEALMWYVKKSMGIPTYDFVPGSFTAAYKGDVALDTQDKAAAAIKAIDELVEKINRELYTETKGRDTKNPDRNSFFYISDRNIDVFTDMIFSYSDVGTAVYRYLFDLIPGGNTVRNGATGNKMSSEDTTPAIIAQAIRDKLDGDIIKLNNFLFTEITQADVDHANDIMRKAVFDPVVWTPVTVNMVADDDIFDDGSVQYNADTLDDELNSILG